jgi:hypothetical protein
MAGSNRVWKLVGLAGLVGVVATGALVARNERERRSYTPDGCRHRLQQRLREADGPQGRIIGCPWPSPARPLVVALPRRAVVRVAGRVSR